MEKEIEIPEGYEARIEGNKVIIEKKQTNDERVRERLLSLVRVLDSLFFGGNNPSREQCLTYLEKQKEPIPIPDKFSGLKSLMLQYLYSAANRKDDTEIESDTDLWGRKILDYVWKYDGLQKEQKPLPGFDELTPDEKMNHPLYLEGFDVGRKVGQVEAGQKPTEWSDEDNIGWDEALACVTRAEKSAKNEEELQNAVTAEKWLKEIKFKYCTHPVKQDWSDEDEKMRDKTLVSLNALIDCVPHKYEEQITKQINWLQVLRHKPHWKPSEIQMKYLDVAIAEAEGHKSYNLADGLEKIKDDLKKL